MRSFILSLRKKATVVMFGINRTYARPAIRCEAHMNELPVPAGPWGPWYKKKQKQYTVWLVLGIAWWLFSFVMALNSGCLYLNWGPPLLPGPPSDSVEECD